MQLKRILIVSSEFPPQPGGIGNHAYNLAKQLNKNGYEVTVLVDARSISGDEEASFDSNQKFSISRIPVLKMRVFVYMKRLFLFYKLSKKCDHIIASGKFSLWLVGLTKWYHRKGCLAIIHGTEVNFKRFVIKKSIDKALKNFDTVVAVSNFTKRLVEPLNLNKLVVIPNGYDSEWWNRSETTHVELSGNPKLITLGRLSERKGQAQVIEHLPYLIKFYPNIQYHCVGLDEDKANHISLAQSLGVERHLTIHGALPHKKLVDMLSQCDIKMMLSKETDSGDVEGFGIAIIEANALGIPAIGTKNSGIEDAISIKSGILINGTDKEEFLKAIETILDDKEEYSQQAKLWADQHKWSKIVEHYIELIETR